MAEVPIFTRIKDSGNKIDPGKQVWEKLFRCSVPFKHTQSQAEIRLFGLPTTGSFAHDERMLNEPVDVMLTIDQMVEYNKTGVTISITKHEDTKVIYDIIRDYLDSWNSRLSSGINTAKAPIDDLLALDKLAQVIYPFASGYFTKNENGLSMMRMFSGSSWISRDSLDKRVEINNTKIIPNKYESLGQLLTEKVLAREKSKG